MTPALRAQYCHISEASETSSLSEWLLKRARMSRQAQLMRQRAARLQRLLLRRGFEGCGSEILQHAILTLGQGAPGQTQTPDPGAPNQTRPWTRTPPARSFESRMF